ncbi:hypothetical protein J2X77_004847, partial [Sphingobacterium sp. 2149]|nr:hypothetical protein [Sphingobacterium sp. 2149]
MADGPAPSTAMEVVKRKKPLTVSSKGFRVKKGTDLLSHL